MLSGESQVGLVCYSLRNNSRYFFPGKSSKLRELLPFAKNSFIGRNCHKLTVSSNCRSSLGAPDAQVGSGRKRDHRNYESFWFLLLGSLERKSHIFLRDAICAMIAADQSKRLRIKHACQPAHNFILDVRLLVTSVAICWMPHYFPFTDCCSSSFSKI